MIEHLADRPWRLRGRESHEQSGGNQPSQCKDEEEKQAWNQYQHINLCLSSIFSTKPNLLGRLVLDDKRFSDYIVLGTSPRQTGQPRSLAPRGRKPAKASASR